MRAPFSTAFWAANCVSIALSKSILFEKGSIITFNEDTQSVEVKHKHSLLITNDRIAAIFDSTRNNITIPPNTEVIYAGNDIISPGFIDTHRHTWQTVYRGIGGDSCLGEYLTRWSGNSLASQTFTPDIMYLSELTGLCEALDAGVTTLVDNASGDFTQKIADANIRAIADSGIRGFYAFPIRRGLQGYAYEDQISHFHNVSEQFENDPLLSFGISYEAFETAEAADLEELTTLAKTSNISFLQTHFVGGPFGAANSPSLLSGLDLLNETFPVLFIHANAISPADIELLRSHNHYIAMAPVFETHHGADNSKLFEIQDQAALSVGTHYASSGDIVSQARLWLQIVRENSFKGPIQDNEFPVNNPMSTNQAFLLATRAGGLSLRRPDLGVIRVGAKADIAVFDGSAPGMLGWQNAVTAVILHSNPSNVKHVLVDGDWKKRNGQMYCALNETDFQSRFLEAARTVQSFWTRTPGPNLTGTVPGSGAPYVTLDEIDALRGPGNGY
ncbi:hypothetical protein F66182_4656 [Fusarium sp. NRRL 66182]|nr:hypothetical protein F66182_4656 [Fusarium sp. NRRL 66182]